MLQIIAEIILTLNSFDSSFLTGILTLIYICSMRDKYKGLKQELKYHVSEEKEEPEKPEIKGSPIRFYAQKGGYIVEEHRGSFFVMIRPNGEKMDKVFYNLDKAEKEINSVVPFLEETRKRRK